MIVHKKPLDYNKHCKNTTGVYVQSHEEPKLLNKNTARTTECIYLRYNDNYQGGHELLNLRTNKIIARRSITGIPITNNIIKMVENLAKIENMPRGFLKINESNESEFEYDQLAGVSDYDLEDQNIAGVQDMTDTNSETDNKESNESTDVMDPNKIESINKKRFM